MNQRETAASTVDYSGGLTGYESTRRGIPVLPSWRNWIAHQTSNLGVAGSNPAGGAFLALLLRGVRGLWTSHLR